MAKYNDKGYDILGYDKDGYDNDGYDWSGYNEDGIDKEGLDEDGYDRWGKDEDGNERIIYSREYPPYRWEDSAINALVFAIPGTFIAIVSFIVGVGIWNSFSIGIILAIMSFIATVAYGYFWGD